MFSREQILNGTAAAMSSLGAVSQSPYATVVRAGRLTYAVVPEFEPKVAVFTSTPEGPFTATYSADEFDVLIAELSAAVSAGLPVRREVRV